MHHRRDIPWDFPLNTPANMDMHVKTGNGLHKLYSNRFSPVLDITNNAESNDCLVTLKTYVHSGIKKQSASFMSVCLPKN